MTVLDQIKSLMKSGDVAEAEALCRKALESDPDNAELKMRYGICRELLNPEPPSKKPRKGISCIEIAVLLVLLVMTIVGLVILFGSTVVVDAVLSILEAYVWFCVYWIFFRLWMRLCPPKVPYCAIAGMMMAWPASLLFICVIVGLLMFFPLKVFVFPGAVVFWFFVALFVFSIQLPLRIVKNVSRVIPCSFWMVGSRALLPFFIAVVAGTAVWVGLNALLLGGLRHAQEHSIEFSKSRGMQAANIPLERKAGCLVCMLEVESFHVKEDSGKPKANGRIILHGKEELFQPPISRKEPRP